MDLSAGQVVNIMGNKTADYVKEVLSCYRHKKVYSVMIIRMNAEVPKYIEGIVKSKSEDGVKCW